MIENQQKAMPAMKKPVLVNVSSAGCRPFPALMLDERALALSSFKDTPLEATHSAEYLMNHWSSLSEAMRTLTLSERVSELIRVAGTPLSDLRLHAAVRPRQVFCTIGNYRSQLLQAAEDADDGPAGPAAAARREAASSAIEHRLREGGPYVCMKSTSSVTDPVGELHIGAETSTLDWEVEIGVVIGRAAFNVNPAEALSYVAGFCVVNDITLRSRIFRGDPPRLGTDWVQSKGGPGWLPTGPWFVPSWLVGDPSAFRLWLRLNGSMMQEGSAADMVFGIPEQIAYLSRHVRLEPGDLICTGSPAGFGSHYGRYLKPGDVVEAGVEGLGTQRIVCIADTDCASRHGLASAKA